VGGVSWHEWHCLEMPKPHETTPPPQYELSQRSRDQHAKVAKEEHDRRSDALSHDLKTRLQSMGAEHEQEEVGNECGIW